MLSFMQKSLGFLPRLLGIGIREKGTVKAAKYISSIAQGYRDFIVTAREMYPSIKADMPHMRLLPRWNIALFNPGRFNDNAYYSKERGEFYLFFTYGDKQYVAQSQYKPSVDLADFRMFEVEYDAPSMGYTRVNFSAINPTPDTANAFRSTYNHYLTA